MPAKVEEVLPLPPKPRPKPTPALECPLRPRLAVQTKAATSTSTEMKQTFTPAARIANDNKTTDYKTMDYKTMDYKTMDNKTMDNKTTDKNDKQLYCAFFPLKGGCQKGDKCVFSHNIPEAHLRDPARIISLPTRCNSQVKGGECKNGPYCPYIHFRAPAEYESLSATTTMSGRTSSAASSPEQSLRQVGPADAPRADPVPTDVGVMDDLDEFPILGSRGLMVQKQKPVAAKRSLLNGSAVEDPVILQEPVAPKWYSPDSPAKEYQVAPREPPARAGRLPEWNAGAAFESQNFVRAPAPGAPICAAPMWGYQVTGVPLPPPQDDIEEALADEDIHFALGCLDDLIADPPAARDCTVDCTVDDTVDDAVNDTAKEPEPDPPIAPEEAPLETASFVKDTRPIAEGYLKAFRGESVIILHSEDDWLYGVISGDGDRLGWFPKKDVA